MVLGENIHTFFYCSQDQHANVGMSVAPRVFVGVHISPFVSVILYGSL